MSKKSAAIPKSTKFEDALGELEELIQNLEGGEQSLEESLVQFERGMKLIPASNTLANQHVVQFYRAPPLS